MLLVLMGLGPPAHAGEATDADDPRLKASRALVAEFENRLRSALVAAISAGGPPDAISICRDTAPGIASELSRRSGAAVGRTSRRLRNPLNSPEPWQVAVLDSFEARKAYSAPLEHFEVIDGVARYMRAIHVQPPCVTCHGADVAPEIRAQLDADYPHDEARGYQPGDLRGAFVVVWPLQEAWRPSP